MIKCRGISKYVMVAVCCFGLFAFLKPSDKLSLGFSISPGNKIEVTAKPEKINDFSANMINTSGDKLNLQWKLVKNTLPKGWDYSMCNFGQCLTGIPKAGKMKTIEKDAKGFLNMHVNPMKAKGTGKVIFYVWVQGDEAKGDTLSYTVTAK